jgi:hypothetical protein
MSLVSVVVGALAALGVVAIALGVAGASNSRLGVRGSGFSVDAWRHLGAGDAVVVAVVAFVALALGGYTAGRMSRRAGVRHGIAVFVLAVAAVAAGVVSRGDLRSWSHTAQLAAAASAAAMFVGAFAGGLLGTRWHRRFDTEPERADDDRRPRPRHALGDDPTMAVDLTEAERQPSIEEEREHQREGRESVGL